MLRSPLSTSNHRRGSGLPWSFSARHECSINIYITFPTYSVLVDTISGLSVFVQMTKIVDIFEAAWAFNIFGLILLLCKLYEHGCEKGCTSCCWEYDVSTFCTYAKELFNWRNCFGCQPGYSWYVFPLQHDDVVFTDLVVRSNQSYCIVAYEFFRIGRNICWTFLPFFENFRGFSLNCIIHRDAYIFSQWLLFLSTNETRIRASMKLVRCFSDNRGNFRTNVYKNFAMPYTGLSNLSTDSFDNLISSGCLIRTSFREKVRIITNGSVMSQICTVNLLESALGTGKQKVFSWYWPLRKVSQCWSLDATTKSLASFLPSVLT